MLKKLLVATIALSFIFAICSLAFAAKGPNEVKKLYQTLPDAPKSISDAQSCLPEQPPTGVKTVADATQTPGGMTPPSMKPSSCEWYYYDCGIAYYWAIPDAYGDDLFNMRFSPPTGEAICTLKTLEIAFYDNYAEFSNTSGEGVTFYVWDDDGFGFPLNVVYTVVVPEASMAYYPNAVDVDVYSQNIIFDADYHMGYTVNNQTLDNIACLSDDGSCGTLRSSEYWGVWGSMLNDWGVDVNFVMAVEACCYEPGDPGVCEWLDYTCGVAYYWTIPDAYGDDLFNMRFSMMDASLECTLMQVDYAFYNNYAEFSNTGPGVDIYVWDDDGLGFPGSVQYTTNVPGASLAFYPNFVSVPTPSLVFTADYHAGWSTVDQVNDNIGCLSDDGSCGQMRSSENWGGTWSLMLTDWGVDVNFLIFAYQCCYIPPSTQNCYDIDYAGPGYYFWTIPDAYGDDFFNMRFTGGDLCTLMTVRLAFYQAGSVGNPGAEIYVWNSDGLLPTTVVTTFSVNPVTGWYPGYEILDVSGAGIIFSSNLHVGYTPIYNDPSDVLAIISDDGTYGAMRSSEYWSGIWGLMVDDWAIDVNFLINIGVCCPPAGYCPTICHEYDDWPTYAHDYARTSQSQISLGDLCGMTCAWNYIPTGSTPISFASPIIAHDMVFIAYDNRMVALNLDDGTEVWRTDTHTDYDLLISGALRTSPTCEGDYLYFGLGSLGGFVKAEAATGDTVWARGQYATYDLPGNAGATRFAPSVIVGNEVYFGCDNGQIYALNKNDGTDIDYAVLNYGVWTSPAYHDDYGLLWFGTSASTSGGAGGVYGIVPPAGGTFATAWYYESPFQSLVFEGYTSGPSYRCDYLFIASNYPFGNFSNWAGIREALEPGTGAEIWPDHYLMGAALYAPPATIGNFDGEAAFVYFANEITTSTGNPFGSGVRCVNFANSTVWLNGAVGAYDNNVTAHASVTCDPIVVYGTRDVSTQGGTLYFVNWNDGSLVMSYNFTGYVLGSAIARHSVNGLPYVVTAVRHTQYLAGPGGVFAFTDDGIPKPKMVVPEHVVNFDGVNMNSPIPVTRTHTDAVINMGCATLTGTATISSSTPPMYRVSDVDPRLLDAADHLINNVIDYRVEDMMFNRTPLGQHKMLVNAIRMDEDVAVSTLPVHPAAASSSVLASSWAKFQGGNDSYAFSVAGKNRGADFVFEIDRTTMQILADNIFYVELVSNDPCYSPEDPGALPQDIITYIIPFEYCPTETGVMAFGTTGEEWYTNYAKIGDGDIAYDFTLDGSDDWLYEATMFFMTSMDDAAWNVFSASAPAFGGYLFPFWIDGIADCGGCDFGATLPVEYSTTGDGFNYTNTVGDLCTFAVVDSMQAEYSGVWPHQNGPSIGLWIKYREVGTYSVTAFPQFDNFKLIVVDIVNRSEEKAPINGLYYGVFCDWDIESGANSHNGDMTKGYIYGYEPGVPSVYGHIGVPRTGGYFCSPVNATDPAYNARINHNPTEVYPPADYTPDSLFSWIDSNPEGALTFAPQAAPGDAPDDQSYEIAFGKVDLAEAHSFGFAVFGIPNSASPDADVDALSIFINKYAGFGRGDVNNDGVIDLRDLVYLAEYVADPVNNPGPVPFMHLGDVDDDGDVDLDDVIYLANFFFYGGPPPCNAFIF